MARTRDIVIGVIIGGSLLVFFLVLIITFIVGRYEEGAGTGWGSKVAIVNLEGAIETSTDIVRQLGRWEKDDGVKAIVLRVNSPGGSVAPSQEIYDKVLKVREESGKPVVVSISSVCASGAYYIACAADQIVANPGSLTGSIGAVMEWPIVNRLMDKVGIQFQVIKSGTRKDIGSPFREPTDSDKVILQAVVDDTYEQFIDVVMSGRQLGRDEAVKIADGSVFSGRQAQKLGLVDSLGTYEDAIDLAGELCGLGKNPPRVKESPRRRITLFDILGSLANLDFLSVLGQEREQVYPRLRYILD